LLLAQRGQLQFDGLCLHTLETGQQRWFDATVAGQDWKAALSPDGHTIATLSVDAGPDDPDSDEASINLIDVETGKRQRLWSAPGSYDGESTIAWSVDGRLVAATYLSPAECSATVVLQTTGNVVGHYDDTELIGSNGVWIGERELLCRVGIPWGYRLTALNVADDTQRPMTEPDRTARCVIGGRVVVDVENRQDEPVQLITTRLDGSDPRPFITLRPRRCRSHRCRRVAGLGSIFSLWPTAVEATRVRRASRLASGLAIFGREGLRI
jgi:hypothetical protein